MLKLALEVGKGMPDKIQARAEVKSGNAQRQRSLDVVVTARGLLVPANAAPPVALQRFGDQGPAALLLAARSVPPEQVVKRPGETR